MPTWNDFLNHPNYDSYWQEQNVLKDLKGITPAVLNVTGWFDQEDFYGPMSIYYTMEKDSPRTKSTLVVGPWNHGGWASGGDSLGAGEVRLVHRRLLPQGSAAPVLPALPEGQARQAAARGGRVRERHQRVEDVRQLAAEAGHRAKLSTCTRAASSTGRRRATRAPSSYDTTSTIPRIPVPYTNEKRPTQGFLWMVEDQWFASTRPDVLTYQTEPLTENVTIAGPILAKMRVATSGTDSDFIVKIIDVYPDALPNDSADRAVPRRARATSACATTRCSSGPR